MEIMNEVGEPLQQVEEQLHAALDDASGPARDVALHLIKGGGKRARPMLTLLAARLFGEDLSRAIPVAVAAEMIHVATLVHDDVIDGAATRRGRPTVNNLWNAQVAVLTGDTLLAKALVLLVDRTSPRIVRIMSDMIYRMCEGEIAQHASAFDPNQTEQDYFERIEKKTALFFAACCEAGALVNGAWTSSVAARAYGRNIGMAFQVIDDLLDVTASPEVLGKPVCSIWPPALTLPVLHVRQLPRNSGCTTIANPPRRPTRLSVFSPSFAITARSSIRSPGRCFRPAGERRTYTLADGPALGCSLRWPTSWSNATSKLPIASGKELLSLFKIRRSGRRSSPLCSS